jgi:hypothetical protein
LERFLKVGGMTPTKLLPLRDNKIGILVIGQQDWYFEEIMSLK